MQFCYYFEKKKMLSQSQELFYQVGGLGLNSGCHFRLVQMIFGRN